MKTWIAVLACLAAAAPSEARKGQPEVTPLEQYVEEAGARSGPGHTPTPGSLWSASAQMTDLTRDLRANQIDDIVTIIVAESASAVASGATKTSRASSANASINALGGLKRVAGPLANLAGTTSDSKLDGQGSTSRETTLSTTVAARVVGVLPNGNLILEGVKDIQVNSETQRVTVRGVIRPADIASDNSIRSERLAQMQVLLNGKGVVNDAVRRPFFLYRLLLGLLPF